VAIDGERVNAVRAVGHEERPAVAAERDLRRICPCRLDRLLDGDEPVAHQLEAGDVRFAADVEHVDMTGMHCNAAWSGASRSNPVEHFEPIAVNREDRHVVAAGVRHEQPLAVDDDRALRRQVRLA
jgi:hypothetical protein